MRVQECTHVPSFLNEHPNCLMVLYVDRQYSDPIEFFTSEANCSSDNAGLFTAASIRMNCSWM